MPQLDDYQDDQEQSETFDETHLDDEGDGDFLLDEADPVLDVTQAEGDADEDEFDEDELPDSDQVMGLSGIEAEADAILGADRAKKVELDEESDGLRGDDEVELVYTGLMRNEKGAQGSAAHWESKRLADDDIADLGYGPDGDEDKPQE